MKIPCYLNEDFLSAGIRIYESWNPEVAPHIAISGSTGSGKTYALHLLLAKISKYSKSSEVTVIDFKGDRDYDFLTGCKRFYRFDECFDGVRQFYSEFLESQRHPKIERVMKVCLIEEWAGMLSFADKKEAEELKKILSSLLMLGRSFNYHIILSQQRLDAESFGKSRDNFGLIITLGNISKEAVMMLYSDYKDEIKNDRTRGTGYWLCNGSEFKRIIVPTISDMAAVNSAILAAVTRNTEIRTDRADGDAEQKP